MNGKQRSFLAGLASTLSPIFQIGKQGVSEETVLQISNALSARELSKIHVLPTCPLFPAEAAIALAEGTGAEVIRVSGTKIVLFRPSDKNRIDWKNCQCNKFKR